MCIALPATIKSLHGSVARVGIMGCESEVNIELIEEPKIGDFILVHAGSGIQKINQEYFNEVQELMEEWIKSTY